MAWVYILSTGVGKYYIGSTTNLDVRIQHHKDGHTLSTKRLKDPELVFSQYFDTLSQARTIEYRLKKMKRRDYLEKIIKDGYIRIG